LTAALPWVAAFRPHWAPVLVAVLALAHLVGGHPRVRVPWPGLAVSVSALILIGVVGNPAIAAGWLLLAITVAALVWFAAGSWGHGRQVAILVALVGWAVAFLVNPDLMAISNGGWLAPAVLLIGARQAPLAVVRARSVTGFEPQPPSRRVRGTLSLRSVVAAGSDGLPRTVPIDLELRAGDSLAILCDPAMDGWFLAESLSGRRRPAAGEIAVDGTPMEPGDRLVAVVALGERFVDGDLETNIGALCEELPEREAIVSAIEACALSEVVESLDEALITADGEPLTILQRLQVAAARVIPSDYRVVVALDPMPWTNPVRGELWRSSVVRASIGRTALWITPDRDLAARADRAVVFRGGSLRPIESTIDGDS
jgi:ABC-type transport system involved in cytochrome bd biosynthesis fused ATPase/permease subunit